jgi:WXG100 family type VII secretion target
MVTDSGKRTIAVNFQVFEDAERDLENSYKAFEHTLRELDRSVRVHLADWVGDARTAYQDDYQAWMTAAKAMHARIADLQHMVRHYHGAAYDAETANLRLFPPNRSAASA